MNYNQQKYGHIEVHLNKPTHSQYNIVDLQIQWLSADKQVNTFNGVLWLNKSTNSPTTYK